MKPEWDETPLWTVAPANPAYINAVDRLTASIKLQQESIDRFIEAMTRLSDILAKIKEDEDATKKESDVRQD